MSKLRFFFVGDVHASSRPFGTRLDNSSETVLKKLEYVLQQAKEADAPVIFTGDFLDNNRNSKEFLLSLIRKFKSSGVKAYSIGGNHECRGTSYASLLDSQLQFLFESDALTFLDSSVRDIETPYGRIRGYSAHSELNKQNADQVIGLVVHHFLIDSFGDTLVAYPSQLKQIFPNLKFIVAGHDHAYYPIQQSQEGIWLVRPGSLMRISSGKENNRKPLYAELELPDYQFYYREVPAAKYNELFSLEVKDEKKEAQTAVDKFILEMRRQVKMGVDLNEIFRARLDLVQDRDSRNLIEEDLKENQFIVA